MKIQFMSDTHDCMYYHINPDADLVIHGGDASDGMEELIVFVNLCKSLDKEVLIVPGNHDLWYQDISLVYKRLDDHGINYLKEDKPFIYKGVTFVGGTLFTNFRSNVLEDWEVDVVKDSFRGFPDFRFIANEGKTLTPNDYITLFNKQYNHINQYRHQDNVVVVTHFPPSPLCSHPAYLKDPKRSGYFTNDLNLDGFNYWFWSHTHYNTQITVDGCQLISNAYGYHKELIGDEAYQPNLLIEVYPNADN